MDLRAIARWAGLVGGLAWLTRYLLDLVSAGQSILSVLYWLGLVLLFAAMASMGAGLVSATWLRAIVAVAFPLLVWSVLEVLHPAGNAYAIDGVFGLLAAVIAAVAMAKAPRERLRGPGRPGPTPADREPQSTPQASVVPGSRCRLAATQAYAGAATGRRARLRRRRPRGRTPRQREVSRARPTASCPRKVRSPSTNHAASRARSSVRPTAARSVACHGWAAHVAPSRRSHPRLRRQKPQSPS